MSHITPQQWSEIEEVVRETINLPKRISLSDNALKQLYYEMRSQSNGVVGADIVLNFKCVCRNAPEGLLRFNPDGEDKLLTLRDLFPDKPPSNHFISQWVIDNWREFGVRPVEEGEVGYEVEMRDMGEKEEDPMAMD